VLEDAELEVRRVLDVDAAGQDGAIEGAGSLEIDDGDVEPHGAVVRPALFVHEGLRG